MNPSSSHPDFAFDAVPPTSPDLPAKELAPASDATEPSCLGQATLPLGIQESEPARTRSLHLSDEPEEDEPEEDEPEEDEPEEDEAEEDEAETNSAEIFQEIRDELAATSTENRRNARRIFDVLKEFGGVLGALSAAVNDIHSSARLPVQPSAPAKDQILEIIELADRVDRIAAAFAREPVPARTWWPPGRRAIEAWRTDRARLAESITILCTHVHALLKNSGIERISCAGEIFDPSYMRADEVVLEPTVDDHTVLAEILPGWREVSSGRIVRFAHVRVSRLR